jgi:hypothetical protein
MKALTSDTYPIAVTIPLVASWIAEGKRLNRIARKTKSPRAKAMARLHEQGMRLRMIQALTAS